MTINEFTTGGFMKLTTLKLYIIIAITTVSLIGIVLIQYNWIDHALKLEEEKFNKQVAGFFTDISIAISRDCDLLTDFNKIALSVCDPGLPLPAENQIMEMADSFTIIVDSIFTANHFSLDYEFGIVVPVSDRYEDSEVILTSGKIDPALLIQSRHKRFLPALDNAAALSFHFPGERSYAARQILFLLIISVLFVLMVIACFGYVIMTIKKQKKLSEMKNDFINNLTHEFKTPIFSISLASKLLGKSKEINDSEKLKNYLQLIHTENNRLRTQVDKVLQMALIDSGNFHLNKSDVDVHKIIHQVTNTFAIHIEEKGGAIDLQLNASKQMLYADDAHLANLVYNLIDNAIKYSSHIPKITVSTMDTENGLCLSVKDNGIGIDAHIQKHIFDKFYRLNSGDVHNVKGFGLGLSYVKSIVDAHKGLIKLNSSKNTGSEFIVTLPIT